jgi:F0F1-type ATP synthase membrane subunit b/b'
VKADGMKKIKERETKIHEDLENADKESKDSYDEFLRSVME